MYNTYMQILYQCCIHRDADDIEDKYVTDMNWVGFGELFYDKTDI